MSQLQNNSSYGPRCNQVNRQAERISRIKSLINRYHALRSETQQLQSQARQTTSSTLKDSGLSSLPAVERSGEWSVYLANSRAPNSTELTLSQLESALHAKWQSLSSFLWNDKALTVVVESQQEIHSSITSGIQAGMAMIKNETLYNLTLESPLLRDADILDGRIMETWRGAPHFPLVIAQCPVRCVWKLIVDAAIKRVKEVNATALAKVRGASRALRIAEENLEKVRTLKEEGFALRTLGDNVL